MNLTSIWQIPILNPLSFTELVMVASSLLIFMSVFRIPIFKEYYPASRFENILMVYILGTTLLIISLVLWFPIVGGVAFTIPMLIWCYGTSTLSYMLQSAINTKLNKSIWWGLGVLISRFIILVQWASVLWIALILSQ